MILLSPFWFPSHSRILLLAEETRDETLQGIVEHSIKTLQEMYDVSPKLIAFLRNNHNGELAIAITKELE